MEVLKTNKKKDKLVFTIKIFDEEFKNVEPIKKCQHCSHRTCKNSNYALRFFDCKKNALVATNIYNIITEIIVLFIAHTIFFYYNFGFFKNVSFFITSLVILDILCTFGEDMVSKIRERHFYNKLKKAKKKKEKIDADNLKEKNQKKVLEEIQENKKSPYYKDVLEAEKFVESLKELVEKYSFGSNEKKINQCVEKLSEIVDILKKDASGYGRVAFLFEAFLPEFYETLSFYSQFVTADVVEEEYENILTHCVDKFLNFLSNQRIEAIFDQKSIELQFKATAETLMKNIDKGED